MKEFQEKQCGSMVIESHITHEYFEISHVGRAEKLTLDRDDLKDLRYLIDRVLGDRP